MKLAIMQPYVFPYIGYYQLANAVDKFVFLDDVNFINKGWINRNNILINGKANLFTIPLKDASQNRLISEIKITEPNGLHKILRTIEMAYKKAPQFFSAFELIQSVFTTAGDSISNIAKESVKQVFHFLDLEKKFVASSDKYNNSQLKGQERIIDISLLEKATDYFNMIGGMELYDSGRFAEKKINLHFIRAKEIVYKQWNEHFIPFLSMIDVLMFNQKQEIRKMLQSYELL
jgi:hypothetical protein